MTLSTSPLELLRQAEEELRHQQRRCARLVDQGHTSLPSRPNTPSGSVQPACRPQQWRRGN